MDELVTRDVFGSMATGTAPVFLASGFEPWFLEAEDGAEDMHSMFGMSRGMIDFLARVSGFDHVR